MEWAAEHGCETTARKALEAGALPCPDLYNTYSPMVLAVRNGHDALVRLFLESVDPNDKDYWYHMNEPLVSAVDHEHGFIAWLLVRHGASVWEYVPVWENYPSPLKSD